MPRLLRIPEAASLGLHAAVILAGHPDGPLSAKDLADRLEASEAHMAKVMQRLVRAGLVVSTRGPKGGFVLAKPASEVSLLEIYEAVEGRVEPASCVFAQPVCGRQTCILGGFVGEFDTRFRGYLAEARLSQFVEEKETIDVRPQADHQD